MSQQEEMTTVTVTEPLKDHLKKLRDANNHSNLNDTIQHLLDHPTEETFDVSEGNMEKTPKPIKISRYTLDWLKAAKNGGDYDTYEDLLRARSGASTRHRTEDPIEWEPLEQ